MVLPLLWMLGALSSFCLMAIGARELQGQLNTFQLLLFRGVISLVLISMLMTISNKTAAFKTQRLPLHLLRNGFHYVGQYAWFLGLTLLPLAQVFALEFTTPLWTLIIASLFLHESITKRKIAAIVLGFIGVLIILQPGFSGTSFNSAMLIVLIGAMGYGVAHSATKGLTRTEHPMTILFYMALLQLPISLILALYHWQPMIDVNLSWLFIVGITGLSAHFCMTKALQLSEVTTVVTLDFIRLPLISLFGIWLYHEDLQISLLIGGGLMLIANLVNLYGKKRPTTP